MNGLTPTVILMFFLATAPVGLLPTVLALVTKQRQRTWIAVSNVVLWGLLYLGARIFTLVTKKFTPVRSVPTPEIWIAQI